MDQLSRGVSCIENCLDAHTIMQWFRVLALRLRLSAGSDMPVTLIVPACLPPPFNLLTAL